MHFVGVMWLGRPTDTVVAITCAEGSPYRQIVVEVDDPQATADRLRSQLVAR